jgi:arginase
MKQLVSFALLLCIFSISSSNAQTKPTGKTAIGIVMQPYTARTGADEFSIAPELLYDEVEPLLKEWAVDILAKREIDLTTEEKQQYGVWHHLGLADGHLGKAVAGIAAKGEFVLGLLGNCNSSVGMLAGLQHGSANESLQTIGMIWIDAHGDFNTPETSLSGWLGGMPVAVSSGQCLHNIRLKAGLEPAIPTGNIVMMGLRDVDPLEQDLIDKSDITTVSAVDLVAHNQAFQQAVNELASRVDVIYLHIDLDILDASEIPGSFFEVEKGPLAKELVEAVKMIVANPKVGALGISSFPTAENGRKKSLQSAMTLIEAGMVGLKERSK